MVVQVTLEIDTAPQKTDPAGRSLKDVAPSSSKSNAKTEGPKTDE